MRWVIYAMIYLGSALMVYNIWGFVRFARYIRGQKLWRQDNRLLYIPIVLLVSFLLGYLMVGFFGKPDIIIAGILFGGSIFVFVMVRVISNILQRIIETEHLEAELLASEQSSQAKSRFLASMSHEMRTPMNVILGMNTLALKNPGLPGAAREQLEKAGHSARRLSDMIDGILDMQLIESGEIAIRSEAFSLKDTLEQINAWVSSACAEKGLDYRTDFAGSAVREYTGDAAHLRQALMHLLDNAVKFTDAPGTVRFTVEPGRGAEGEVRFIVSDTGIGIDETFLSRATEPFAQEDTSATRRFGGTGMGLSVANAIIARMGGALEIASRKGEGSTFTVVLPLSPVESGAEDSDALGAAEDSPAAFAGLGGRRVLVADDMAENAEIVSDLLELEGMDCDTAGTGLEALRMMEQSDEGYYDAILMDLRMPVMDGLEATRRIRALDRADAKAVPIIALTANTFDSDIQSSLEAGMNAHLVKPVDADALYAALDHWINRTQERGTQL